MLKVEQITKTHTTKQGRFTSVNDVSFHVAKGEVVGIVGHSGAGKSTLLRLLNGLISPTSGNVYVDGLTLSGINIKKLNTLRYKIGTIFQNYNLLSSLTVRQNIALQLKIAKYPKRQLQSRVDEVLSLVQLIHKADDYPRTLSGGEKQRVAIARAISNHPTLLLCDEITSALDQNTTNEIITILENIKNREALTIIFVSHELEVVSRLCSRVIVMDKGRIVEDSDVTTLFLNPQAPASQKLVNTILDYERFNKRLNYLFGYKEAILNEPILSKAIVKYKIEPSILYAKSLYIKDELHGFMIMRFNSQLRMNIKTHLKDRGIFIKELGSNE